MLLSLSTACGLDVRTSSTLVAKAPPTGAERLLNLSSALQSPGKPLMVGFRRSLARSDLLKRMNSACAHHGNDGE
jgi:hypothetical protein